MDVPLSPKLGRNFETRRCAASMLLRLQEMWLSKFISSALAIPSARLIRGRLNANPMKVLVKMAVLLEFGLCKTRAEQSHSHTIQERKRHININLFGRWPSGDRGVSRPGGQGSIFMYYPRNPRNINLFVRIPDREDRWPGWVERVLCEKVLCAFSAP